MTRPLMSDIGLPMYSDYHEDKFDHELLLSCWSAKEPSRNFKWEIKRDCDLFRAKMVISYNGAVRHEMSATAPTKKAACAQAAKDAYYTLQNLFPGQMR